jgi:hypothetical protein
MLLRFYGFFLCVIFAFASATDPHHRPLCWPTHCPNNRALQWHNYIIPPQIREFDKSPMQRGAMAASNAANNRVLPMFNYKSLRITLGKKSSSSATNPTQWWLIISSRLEFLKVKPSLDSNAVSCADPFWRVKSGSLSQRLNMTFRRFNF